MGFFIEKREYYRMGKGLALVCAATVIHILSGSFFPSPKSAESFFLSPPNTRDGTAESPGGRIYGIRSFFDRAGVYPEIFVDISDTVALPPEGIEKFPPHEITLRNLVLQGVDGAEAETLRVEAEEGYELFQRTRRDKKISAETSYGYWLAPFAGKLTVEHMTQLVADWRFNPGFTEAVALIRDALGIPPDETVRITVVSGNVATINRVFFEREDIARILREHHIEVETIQGVELVMENGVFQGGLQTVGTLFNASPDDFPQNAFVIGDNPMEGYGFNVLPLFINAQSLDIASVRERLRRYFLTLGDHRGREKNTSVESL